MDELGKVIYTVRSSIPAEWVDEFNRWQREEHIPRLLLAPGYRGVQRLARLDRPHAFMNVWQIDSRTAFDSNSHAHAARTPWRARVAAIRKDHSVDFYAPIEGDGVVAGRVTGEPPRFLIRYDLEGGTDAAQCVVNDGIGAIAGKLAADTATSYIRALKTLDGSKNFVLLHYLCERRDPTTFECDWCERTDAAPYESINR